MPERLLAELPSLQSLSRSLSAAISRFRERRVSPRLEGAGRYAGEGGMQLWKHPLLALADLEPDPLKPRFSGHDISRLQNTSSLSRIGDGEKLRNSW